MANPSPAHEPSMEEILASIRQIISEDGEAQPVYRNSEPESAGTAIATAPQPAPRPANASSLPSAAPSGSDLPNGQKSDGPNRKSSASGQPRSEAAAGSAALPSGPGVQSGERRLLSSNSDAAVSGAFSVLAHTILSQNARTLEDLVAEMMRPMLKSWLDDNLPSLVERLVKEEIERVSRGRR